MHVDRDVDIERQEVIRQLAEIDARRMFDCCILFE